MDAEKLAIEAKKRAERAWRRAREAEIEEGVNVEENEDGVEEERRRLGLVGQLLEVEGRVRRLERSSAEPWNIGGIGDRASAEVSRRKNGGEVQLNKRERKDDGKGEIMIGFMTGKKKPEAVQENKGKRPDDWMGEMRGGVLRDWKGNVVGKGRDGKGWNLEEGMSGVRDNTKSRREMRGLGVVREVKEK